MVISPCCTLESLSRPCDIEDLTPNRSKHRKPTKGKISVWDMKLLRHCTSLAEVALLWGVEIYVDVNTYYPSG